MEKVKIPIVQIAEIQIEKAILLLIKYNDPISAITLAGAAEEILGKIAKNMKGRNALADEVVFATQIAEYLQKPKPLERVVINLANKIKNQLKHNDKGEIVEIEANFKYEAESILIRAINNYMLIFNKMPKSKLIDKWFENITL